eukprot:TRINITY_DN6836_c0_g1_i2.p1 TRINITY_DN6836_c0_g1~~TRINITY_DN6836_c0_g1_i2.p1  ORF type:complete len:192 (+),score=35.85 TRINITY_DN6836_c0_g1_i2:295-870(+)
MRSLLHLEEIVGGQGDFASAVTREVGEGDVVMVGDLKVNVLYTPCHTPGHVCYFVPGSPGAVFTGDTMFVGGCGNFNTGTPAQMLRNMCQILGNLPGDTLVYVGHEYTLRNYAFAMEVEPENKKLKEKNEWAQSQRKQGQPTVPSTIEEERATNPFMRVNELAVQRYTGKTNPVEVIFQVRRLKDEWGRRN